MLYKSDYEIEYDVLVANQADSLRHFEPGSPVPDESHSRPAKQ